MPTRLAAARLKRKASVAALSLLSALIAGCGGGETGSPSNESAAHSSQTQAAMSGQAQLKSAGATFELTVTGLNGGTPQSSIEWLEPAAVGKSLAILNTLSGSLEMAPLSTNRFDFGGYRYIESTFRVRNAPACAPSGGCAGYTAARGNATFLATLGASSIDLTAFTSLKRADGTNVAAGMARAMMPTNVPSTITGQVDSSKASLQVFRESELPAPLSGTSSIFPYGFVVRNSLDGSRLLAANPSVGQFDGVVTFAFRIPTLAVAADNPHSFTIRLQTVDDDNTRVTQASNEQTFIGDRAAGLRLAALTPTPYYTDLVVLGGRIAQSTIGDPICRVRTAGAAGTPVAWLANQPATPVTIAAAPMNLESVGRNESVSLGYCDNMLPPTAASFMVYGSQSGLRVSGAPYASGSITGGQYTGTPNQLIWKIAYPFLPGETVTVVANNFNKNSSGIPVTPFVGRYRVKGSNAGSLGTFGSVSTYTLLPGATPLTGISAPTLADLNRDGKPDLIVSLRGVNGPAVMLGNGAGGFGAATTYPLSSSGATVAGAGAVVVGDVNADGKLDVVRSSNLLYGNTITVFLGDGSGGLVTTTTLPTEYSGAAVLASLYLGDLNGDGKLDLISLNSSSYSVRLGDGVGGFGAPTLTTAGVSGISKAAWPALALGDVNGDGKLDLAQVSGNTVLIRLGTGSGTFGAPTSYSTGQQAYSIAFGDLNNDGRLDLMVSRSYPGGASSGDVGVMLGNGTGGFSAATGYVVGNLASQLVPADVNGDGKLDIVASNYLSGGKVMIGNGAGGFSAGVALADVGVPNDGAAVADLNGDGRLDVVIAGGVSGAGGVVSVQLGN